jgi:hypothetical protein
VALDSARESIQGRVVFALANMRSVSGKTADSRAVNATGAHGWVTVMW